MRSIKLLTLAALTALIATAYFGASTASAVVLCEENIGHAGTCPAKKIYGSGHVYGVSPQAEIYDESLEKMMNCESQFLGLVETRTEEFQPVLIEKLFTFSNCEGICESVEANVPIMLAFEKGSLDAWLYRDTEISMGPTIPTITMNNCYEFGLKCVFQEEEVHLTYNNEQLFISGSRLGRTPGSPKFCPTEVLLVATYTVLADLQTPYPLYVTHNP